MLFYIGFTVCQAFYLILQYHDKLGIILPILQKRKLRHKPHSCLVPDGDSNKDDQDFRFPSSNLHTAFLISNDKLILNHFWKQWMPYLSYFWWYSWLPIQQTYLSKHPGFYMAVHCLIVYLCILKHICIYKKNISYIIIAALYKYI